MRVSVSQLPGQLRRGLAPVYLIHGDEPLQLREALDGIRHAAREQGYAERVVFDVDTAFDWNSLRAETDSLSLFAERRVIELRMPGGKPGRDGSACLSDYCKRPAEGVLLLVSCGRLEGGAYSSAWFKALDKAGSVVQAQPVEARALPAWVRQRAAALDMNLSQEAAQLIAERVEGNLLACEQELEKLRLVHGAGGVDVDQVLAAVFDSSRYNIYDLMDSALAGDKARTVRVLRSLKAEGAAPLLLLWVMGKDLRVLCDLAREAGGKRPPESLFARHRLRDKRKALVQAALSRHGTQSLYALLTLLGRVDRAVKGQRETDPWDELTRLGMALAGDE